MDAINLLKEDHKKVADLFKQVEATDEEAKHQQLFEKIKTELETHTLIEEKVLYPVLEQYEDLKDLVLEAYEEHKQVKTLIREIDKLAEGSERFDAKLKVMGENVEHHVKEEETEMFPKMKKLIGNQQLERLGADLKMAKEESQNSAKGQASGKG
jgi:iron-sulfur cluster repair protein YtfE (RIC family)